jgi:two-component system OmpR family sensor kinase
VTIRLRLTIWYALTLVVLFAVVGGVVWYQYSRMVRETVDQELAARVDDIGASLGRSATATPDTTDPAWRGIFGAVFARTGSLIGASQDAPKGLAAPSPGRATLTLGSAKVAYAIDAIAGPNGTTIVAGRPLAQVDSGLADLARLMLLAGGIATLAALGGGWWLAGRALHPVSVMVREVNAIETGDLLRRLDVPAANDELGRLGRTLNAMLDRVAETVRRERRFVATASHDLRTPIATLQAELELSATYEHDPDALLASIRLAHGDAVRLSTLASDLLRLAEAESSGRELLRQPVPIRDLVDGLITRFAPVADARDVRVVMSAPDTVVRVDRVRMEQAIGNLLNNAVLESDPGSVVEITVRATAASGASGGTLAVDVLDRGPGVPAELRDRLFQPFGAGPAGRDGRTGLGLATAAAAVAAHHGHIGYQDRPGGGAWFSLEVPLPSAGTADAADATGQMPVLSPRAH